MSAPGSAVIHPSERRSDVIFLWGFSAVIAAAVFFVSRSIGSVSPAWIQWLERVLWLVVVYLIALSLFATWRSLMHGSALLRFDATPSAGSWLSGAVELTKLPRLHPSLHVECIRSSRDVDNSKNIRDIVWQSITIIDRERLSETDGRTIVPLAVWLPQELPPTSASKAVDVTWSIRIAAGPYYAKEFQFPVAAADPEARAVSPGAPRVMPVLPASALAKFDNDGSRAVIVLPFPMISFSLSLLFLAIAISLVAGQGAALEDAGIMIIAALLFLSAFLFLVVAMTPRRIEFDGDVLRIRRGVMGLGFHSTIARGDVLRVEETAPVDATTSAYYGVNLHTHSGRIHVAAIRLKEPALARGVAAAIESALKGNTGAG